MAIEVAKYQFQSWVRKGISTQIIEPDSLGNPGAVLPPNERATVPIGVSVNTTPLDPKPFALIGPGDIVGIQRDMIVRTRAAPLDHELRAELPRVHRVLRRGLPVALHPGEARGRQAAAVDCAAGPARR